MEEEKDLKYFIERSPLVREHNQTRNYDTIDKLFLRSLVLNHNEVAKEVINLGFNPNTILRETWESNCLTYACLVRNEEMMRFLIDKTENLNYQNNDGCTALTLSCWDGNKEFIKFLLKFGVDINFINRNGYTSLAVTYKFHHYDMAEFLLENGAKVLYGDDDLPLKWGECENKEFYEELFLRYRGKNIKPAKSK